jgi:CPA1 family monovalent cation:H+ antiporter
VREEILAHLAHGETEPAEPEEPRASHQNLHRRALSEARRVVFDMRAREEIGDAAFHRLEEELDWLEMGVERG